MAPATRDRVGRALLEDGKRTVERRHVQTLDQGRRAADVGESDDHVEHVVRRGPRRRRIAATKIRQMVAVQRVEQLRGRGQERGDDALVLQQHRGTRGVLLQERGLDLRADERDLRLGDPRHRGARGTRDRHAPIVAGERRGLTQEPDRVDVAVGPARLVGRGIGKAPGPPPPAELVRREPGRGRDLCGRLPASRPDQVLEAGHDERPEAIGRKKVVGPEPARFESLEERQLLRGVLRARIVDVRGAEPLEVGG